MQIFQFNCLTIEWVGADSNCARWYYTFYCMPSRAGRSATL